MKSALGSRKRSAVAPTRSVLQSPPRTKVWTAPVSPFGDPADAVDLDPGVVHRERRLVTERLAVAGRPGRSGTGSSSARTPTTSRCVSLDDGAAAAGRGTMDGFQEGHVAEPGREVGQGAGRSAPDGADEVDLRGPAGAVLVADGDRSRAAVPRTSSIRCASRSTTRLPVVPWNVTWSDSMPLVRADISTTAVTSSGYSTSARTWSGTSAAIGPAGPGRSGAPRRVTARDRLGLAEPAGHRLGQDAEGHDVLAARRALPAPEVTRIARRARVPGDLDVADAPDGAVAEQADDRAVRPGGEAGRHDHRDLLGVGAGGAQHRPGILGAGGHPGLGQDVLAGLERGDRDRRVEHRPGADEDRVELGSATSACHDG